MARMTWYRPDGSWGVDGVDLSALPPRIYGALCKLMRMENLIDEINRGSDISAELSTEELLGMGGARDGTAVPMPGMQKATAGLS